MLYKPFIVIVLVICIGSILYVSCRSDEIDEKYLKFVPPPKPTLPMIDFPKGSNGDFCFWNKMCLSNFCHSMTNQCSNRLPERKPNGSDCESRLNCLSNFCGAKKHNPLGLENDEIFAIEEERAAFRSGQYLDLRHPKCMDKPANYISPICKKIYGNCTNNLSYDGTYVTGPPEFSM